MNPGERRDWMYFRAIHLSPMAGRMAVEIPPRERVLTVAQAEDLALKAFEEGMRAARGQTDRFD